MKFLLLLTFADFVQLLADPLHLTRPLQHPFSLSQPREPGPVHCAVEVFVRGLAGEQEPRIRLRGEWRGQGLEVALLGVERSIGRGAQAVQVR